MPPPLPIADYGVIGNLRTLALVGTSGSIDWCCFPDVDASSVFAALLDPRRGGHFRVAPVRPYGVSRRYLDATNVLETTFDAEGGRLVVTDFMPLRGSIEPGESHEAPPEIHRLLHAEGGRVEVEVSWAPRFDYARAMPRFHTVPNGVVATATDERIVLAGLPEARPDAAAPEGPIVEARFTLEPGEVRPLVLRWDSADATCARSLSLRALEDTVQSWRAWARKPEATGDRAWAGYWNEHVIRSELTLKLLTYAPTGAIVAAGTTSLPETLGGVRNWDYRYAWIRDAGLAAQALFAMGHRREAEVFIDWAEYHARTHGEERWGLRLMYDVHGAAELPENTLDHLAGYADSQPVRVGNGASDQLQLDVFHELISAAYEITRLGGDLVVDTWPFLAHLATRASEVWPHDDAGIWEMRNDPAPFVYSKAMVWTALDRALRLADEGRIAGDTAKWTAARNRVRAETLARGYNEDLGAFTLIYDGDALDAANLLFPVHEFLPVEDPRVRSTIDRTLERLTANDLVYRYRVDDGLPGEEGAFALCTFWMVDALALSGRLDEAYRIFDGITARVNDLGLLSEQIDPNSGAFLGNFPQAFSHIGLINSALYLAHMEGRETPVAAPMGTKAHRREVGHP